MYQSSVKSFLESCINQDVELMELHERAWKIKTTGKLVDININEFNTVEVSLEINNKTEKTIYENVGNIEFGKNSTSTALLLNCKDLIHFNMIHLKR